MKAFIIITASLAGSAAFTAAAPVALSDASGGGEVEPDMKGFRMLKKVLSSSKSAKNRETAEDELEDTTNGQTLQNSPSHSPGSPSGSGSHAGTMVVYQPHVSSDIVSHDGALVPFQSGATRSDWKQPFFVRDHEPYRRPPYSDPDIHDSAAVKTDPRLNPHQRNTVPKWADGAPAPPGLSHSEIPVTDGDSHTAGVWHALQDPNEFFAWRHN